MSVVGGSMSMEHSWIDRDEGEAKVLEQISSVLMFNTSSKWTGLGLNPELRRESPATNRHCHGMAQEIVIFNP